MTSNIDEPSISTNSPINVKIDCEPAELEHFEETKLEDCDLANSPRRSRTVSVDNESELLERLEDFEETKLEDCDLSKSPRRSRNDSLDDESDNRNSPQENLSRKRQRSSSSRSFEEHFEETKLKDCDLANSPRRSRTVSVDNESELLERLEDFDETKLEDCDLSNSPRRSRSVSVDNESDNRNSPQEYLSRKRQRSSSSRSLSPRRKAFRGRDGRRHDDNPKPSRCLGVFGLSVHTRENDLRGIFSKYGEIETIIIVRSFAFVYYEAIEDARSAKKRCNGIEIKGRNIRVDYSMTEKPNDSSKSRSRYDWNRSHGRNNNRRHYDNRRFRSSPRNNRRRS